MVLKTMSRKSNGGQLVAYVCRYVLNPDKNKEVVKAPHHSKESVQFIIRHNLRARTSVKNFIKEFNQADEFRLVHRKNSVKIFHTVIAFGKEDKHRITNDILKDIAAQFISLRGKNTLVLGTVHRNTDSIHLHLLVSGVQLNGRSSRISKHEHQRIKIALEKYQQEKYPELIHSRVAHKELYKPLTREQIVAAVQNNRQTVKATLCTVLNQAFEKSSSVKEFLAHVTEAGYRIYERGEKLQGVIEITSGMKFRFSTLGFQQSVEDLQQRSIAEEHALVNIQKLRKSKEKEKQMQRPLIPPKTVEQKQANTVERKMLDELATLRSQGISREQAMDFNALPTLFDELTHINVESEPVEIEQSE